MLTWRGSRSRDRLRLTLGLAAVLVAGSAVAGPASAQSEEAPGELRTDSRAKYVHRITLYDHEGEAIDPGDVPARPYSPTRTCGKCHAVGSVRHGFHFNEDRAGEDFGRMGEPWILTEPATGSQLPVSGRGWPGTFHPEQVGLTRWEFTKRFGFRTPGGGLADPPPVVIDESPESARWNVSGTLEVDCLVCHSADGRHDPVELERQIGRENFRWSPTAAAGLGVVRGDAKNVPDDFDPLAPPNPDYPEQALPTVEYDESLFDNDDRVLFDLTRNVPAGRCYFCHTVRAVGGHAGELWQTDEDIHLTAGLTCTDCHRGGMPHDLVRGYADEPAAQRTPSVQTLTCRGCHLGEGELADGPGARAGRLGAPYPLHRGLPPVHLEKLTCTACHSGPWPQDAAQRFQTALAHGLGLPTRERSAGDPPRIVAPVFLRNAEGQIGVFRMTWPAYFGVLENGSVAPLPLDAVQRAGRKLGARAKSKHPATLGPLEDADITMMLTQLSGQRKDAGGKVVYLRGGLVFELDEQGALISRESDLARPYVWPLAHDVRPAAQSLGIHGCTDCHADGAPLYFGSVSGADDGGSGQAPGRRMFELRGDDESEVAAWAWSFGYRATFKIFGFIGAALIAIAIVRHGMGGAGARFSRWLGGGTRAEGPR